MVKTSNDVMDINPLESMNLLDEIGTARKKSLADKKKEFEELEKKKNKELEDLEARKKKEIEELEKIKKKEIEELGKKKKELEDLEKKKVKEIEETQDLIDEKFQDLMRHKRMLIAQEAGKSQSLEEVAAEQPSKPQAPQPFNDTYSGAFQSLKAPTRLYDVMNKDFYSSLVDLKEKAMRGDLTPQDEQLISELRDKFESFSQPAYLGGRDEKQYVRRGMKVIEEIDTSFYIR